MHEKNFIVTIVSLSIFSVITIGKVTEAEKIFAPLLQTQHRDGKKEEILL